MKSRSNNAVGDRDFSMQNKASTLRAHNSETPRSIGLRFGQLLSPTSTYTSVGYRGARGKTLGEIGDQNVRS